MGGSRESKINYFSKLKELLETYNSIFVVGVDNVSSQQMHEIRKSLRGRAVVLMGKNTMIRTAIRGLIAESPKFEKLLPFVKGNVGFIFTNEDLKTIRDEIVANKKQAPARAGVTSDVDVVIPAQQTTFDPSKTSFFQAIGVATKITRGNIEIISDIKVVEANSKVGASEATLLNMLNISPFTYGLVVQQVYNDGQVFPSSILDISDDELVSNFVSAINSIAAISLAISYPTLPAVSHSIMNNYKNLLAVSVATEYTFEGSEQIKDRIANPDAYASAAPAAAAASEEKAEEAAEEEEEESDDDMGFGLFD